MEHLLLKAAVTATDEGIFEAVMSTKTKDREKDVVEPAAVVTAINKWNRALPLSWNHSTEAADIFGQINQGSAKALNAVEVAVAGEVDLESDVGREAWRSFKRRTVGFSFGYLIVKGKNLPGGGKHITELDIFEVTATPTPMNNDTRVLSTKSAEIAEKQAELQELLLENQKRILELTKASPQLREAIKGAVNDGIGGQAGRQSEIEELRARVKALEEKAEEADKETKSRSVDPLKNTAMTAALSVLTEGATPPKAVTKEKPTRLPELDPEDLRQQSRDLMVQVLTGTEVT